MARTARRLECVLLAFLMLLGGATLPLWRAAGEYPRVPWFAWAGRVPAGADGLLLTTVALSNGALLVSLAIFGGRRPRLLAFPRLALGVSFAGLLLLDQHRLQPWAWHLLLLLAFLWLAPAGRALSCARALVVSIYVYSAVSKFDAAYLATHGQMLLEGLADSVGLDARPWPEGQRRTLAAAFPLGELLIAAALAWRRTRWIGACGSMLLHGTLIAALGPLGLDHGAGVLLWNACFLIQNPLLFLAVRGPRTEDNSVMPDVYRLRRAGGIVATALCGFALAAPLGESFGLWDHWPGWGLYCSRPAIVRPFVREVAVVKLPAALQRYFGPSEPLTDWRPLSLEAWSFETLRCPAYPQERYRLAVVRALAERYHWGDDVRVVLQSSPNRWTGKREPTELRGAGELQTRCRRFWLNTSPRAKPAA